MYEFARTERLRFATALHLIWNSRSIFAYPSLGWDQPLASLNNGAALTGVTYISYFCSSHCTCSAAKSTMDSVVGRVCHCLDNGARVSKIHQRSIAKQETMFLLIAVAVQWSCLSYQKKSYSNRHLVFSFCLFTWRKAEGRLGLGYFKTVLYFSL